MGKKKKPQLDDGTVCVNKKARMKFIIEDTIEAGLVLTGNEVKSLREKAASINESFAKVHDNGEMYLYGFQIDRYSHASTHTEPDPLRAKKILLKRKEIDRLVGQIQQKGKSVIPLKVYFVKRGVAKVLLGVGVGKKDHDRREDIKRREADREAQRAMKQFTR